MPKDMVTGMHICAAGDESSVCESCALRFPHLVAIGHISRPGGFTVAEQALSPLIDHLFGCTPATPSVIEERNRMRFGGSNSDD